MASTNYEPSARRLICERKGWGQEALPCIGLMVAWSEPGRLSMEKTFQAPLQPGLGI